MSSFNFSFLNQKLSFKPQKTQKSKSQRTKIDLKLKHFDFINQKYFLKEEDEEKQDYVNVSNINTLKREKKQATRRVKKSLNIRFYIFSGNQRGKLLQQTRET